MERPSSFYRTISPPPTRKALLIRKNITEEQCDSGTASTSTSGRRPCPDPAAVEAGEVVIENHIDYFAEQLRKVSRPHSHPRISIDDFAALYKRNEHRSGRHFVVHQHDHPISGVHYDLRLQFSDTSTVSFAVPYGLPGNPNSVRPNRMAIETRVHNLWNNLVESASRATGSLLIWDTGEYEVLPWSRSKARVTDDELSADDESSVTSGASDSEKLIAAFQSRHIRLRLHGVRLPPGYTVSLRLPSSNDRSDQPEQPKGKRRRVHRSGSAHSPEPTRTDGHSNDGDRDNNSVPASSSDNDAAAAAAAASEDETYNSSASIRANNAYTGSHNTIGSIHQRHWFLTLDRRNSGFEQARSGADSGRWTGAWEPFYVRGRDVERSVVTGRNADGLIADCGLRGFVGRKMWRPILN